MILYVTLIELESSKMHPEMDIMRSIEWQGEKLANKFKTELKDLKRYEDDPVEWLKTFLRYVSRLTMSQDKGYDSLFPMFLVINNRCDLAWTAFWYGRYWGFSDDMYLYWTHLEESPESWDLPKYWNHVRDSKVMTKDEIREYVDRAYQEKKVMPLMITNLPFKLDNEAYNREHMKWLTTNADTGPSEKDQYDCRPSARYVTKGDDKLFYMKHDGLPGAIDAAKPLLRREMHAEVAECIFRMRYILSTGEAPSHLMEFGRNKYWAPAVEMYDCWYRARMEKDVETKKALGWTAVFWLVEGCLRNLNTDNGPFMCFKFDQMCELIGEFELLGERQEEFLSHFALTAMFASIGYCRKLLKNPPRMVQFSERGLPTRAETKKMYDAMFPPKNAE